MSEIFGGRGVSLRTEAKTGGKKRTRLALLVALLAGGALTSTNLPAAAQETSKAHPATSATQAPATTKAAAAPPPPPAEKPRKTRVLINTLPAKKLFAAVRDGAPLRPAIYGGYARGCYAGGVALPPNGEAWQAMRLHRNRNWGHPRMVAYIKRLATEARAAGEWRGLLVGDLSQPRGGPMLTGHRSHQLGIDADIWLREMPEKRFTLEQQTGAKISAISLIGSKKELGYDKYAVDDKLWTEGHYKLIRRAASHPDVARIFLHPAIKKKLCQLAPAGDRGWLRKIRPWWGHHYHMHVRLSCPPGNPGCKNQRPVGGGDGCGKPIENWLKTMRRVNRPRKIAKPRSKPKTQAKRKRRKRRGMTIAGLPPQCRNILLAGQGAEQIAKKVKASPADIARWRNPAKARIRLARRPARKKMKKRPLKKTTRKKLASKAKRKRPASLAKKQTKLKLSVASAGGAGARKKDVFDQTFHGD